MDGQHELDERGFALNTPRAGEIPSTDIEAGDIVAFAVDGDKRPKMLVSMVSGVEAHCEGREDGRAFSRKLYVNDLILWEKAAARTARKVSIAEAHAAALAAQAEEFTRQQLADIERQANENAARIALANETERKQLAPYDNAGVQA